MMGAAWEPPSIDQVAYIFEGCAFRWWICGGFALELHVGESWRPHEDLDIGICRYQVDEALSWFTGWDVYIAASGTLTRWQGGALDDSANNIWIRETSEHPWIIDLTVGLGTEDQWVYRRDTAVRRPWESAVLRTKILGIPYLAPELQLLFKSKNPRAKDHRDAEIVIPILAASERAFLGSKLSADHEWQYLLGDRDD